MDVPDREALEARKLHLRHTLKEWEAAFHTQNGRKAGRDDIKADPTIAAHYKEYQKVQDMLSGKQPSTTKQTPRKQKRSRPETSLPESPSKRSKSVLSTPQKQVSTTLKILSSQEHQDEDQNTPAVRRTFLDPTPQKDGIVLGLFDLLPVAQTPSNKNRTVLGELDRNASAVTPSKLLDASLQETACQYEERARGSRTPASTGKRFLLDQFMTPQRKEGRRGTEAGEANRRGLSTPSSTFRQQFSTPAFLRRDNFLMDAIDEAPESPQVAQPWKRRSFGRSLSGMIQDMRREAEKAADEELDLLREMEDEAEGRPRPNKVVDALLRSKKAVMEDCQAVPPTVTGLDRDGFVPSDVEQSGSDDEHGNDGDTQSRPWRKKGVKRQTRRVNMRPVAKKVQPQQSRQPEIERDSDGGEVVGETKLSDEDVPSDLERTFDGENDESKDAKDSSKEPEVTKRGARKTRPDAHANYRALKIKNKNSKAKGRGRFARRR
ncbi:uncharacterized protein PV09_03477 [Verruconis gallopava]|uniref:DNA replication regulator SLD2 n=1 Tax=Verruconis gallopava TaxID=253628 RepID=A0A0D1XS91_9PEZI|nr:uncharacterized protein PV09_03477 [Verruconis gallopava]KIW05606.1 hypothetical protein PV09_03477 [Verruconis gallopava]